MCKVNFLEISESKYLYILQNFVYYCNLSTNTTLYKTDLEVVLNTR